MICGDHSNSIKLLISHLYFTCTTLWNIYLDTDELNQISTVKKMFYVAKCKHHLKQNISIFPDCLMGT